MIVELGNPQAKMADGSLAELGGAPSVTYFHIPDPDETGLGGYKFDAGTDLDAFKAAMVEACATNEGVTNGLDEVLLMLTHPWSGLWRPHSGAKKPSWVHSDNEDLMAALGALHGGIPLGRPADLEDTHYTKFGPPGVVPGAAIDLQALLVNTGRDQWARVMGGNQVGYTATSAGAAPTTTTFTDTGAAWTTNQWANARIVVGGVWANIVSNTATVLTVDRWYAAATPGGAAGSTPGATVVYQIMDGGAPGWFMGLGNTNTTPNATDTSMSGEITTVGGGLIRKICPWAHSAGTNTYTLTPVYTANGSDTLAVTIYRIGVFWSMVTTYTTGGMMYETLLSASATLNSSGDQLTVTETVTGT